jgi:2-oxoisovalerate dehydrogenase E1 component alpha subunit
MIEPTTESVQDIAASTIEPVDEIVYPSAPTENGHARVPALAHAVPEAVVPPAAVAASLTTEQLRDAHYWMALARGIDDRMWVLNRQGMAPFVISCCGHEAAQVGSAMALAPRVDWVLPYYRDLGVMLVLGMTPREAMLQFLAKGADPCSGGRQMPGHWSYPALKVVTGSSPVATQLLHATGIALASKLKREPHVTAVYFGEGCTAGGDFHEGLNFAAIHRLPVVFFCENNGYAISVPQDKEMAVANVADRAGAYGMPGEVVDGNNVMAVYAAMCRAVARARRGDGPTLLEAKTYRLVPHSSDDDDRVYRTREEVESWRRRDPIEAFRRRLQELGVLNEGLVEETKRRIARDVDDATEFAAAAPYQPVERVFDNVYARAAYRAVQLPTGA